LERRFKAVFNSHSYESIASISCAGFFILINKKHLFNLKEKTVKLLTKEEYEKIASSICFNTMALIDGKLVNSVSGKTFPTFNPATGQKLIEVTACEVRM